jgi:amino acid adenylation domain-containing protein
VSQPAAATHGPHDLTVTPASYAQERVWLAQQLDGSAARYNVQAGLRLRGTLDRAALDGALTELTRRQQVLRTSLVVDGGEVMQVIAPPAAVTADLADLTGLADPAAGLERRAQAELRASLDPARGPCVRFALIRLADDDHVLLITMDHLMADPWSAAILQDEFARLYLAQLTGSGTHAPPPVQYADFALWQRELLAAGNFDPQVAYWRGQLGDDPPRLALPAAGGRRNRQPGRLERPLPVGLTDALEALARGTSSSVFMTLFAGFAVLLGRYSGQDDVVIGTLLAGRTSPETERLVGFFANAAALRADLSGRPSFATVLRRVRDMTLSAYANQDVPFQHVASELAPQRGGGDLPFFDTLFQLADLRCAAAELPGLRIEHFRAASQPTPVDLGITVMREGPVAVAVCDYDTGLFGAAAIGRLLDHYVLVLETMTEHPDSVVADLELRTAADQRWLAELTPRRPAVPADWTTAAWFAGLAQRFAGNLAVDSGDTQLTYRELNTRANRVAHALRAQGVGPEALVGIALERGIDLVTCILGVFKAGGAYLPLDPGYPAERLGYMVDDAGPPWIITTAGGARPGGDYRALLAADLIAAGDGTSEGGTSEGGTAEADPRPGTVAANLAYVIYTSGSTGRPKGVAVSHRGLAVITAAQQEFCALTAADRVLQLASPSFDISIFEMLLPFGFGAALCLPSRDAVAHGDLAQLAGAHSPSVIVTPPGMLAAVGDDVTLPGVRMILVGGEACTPRVATRWSSDGRLFFNGYGPTEATIWSTMHQVAAGGAAPVGAAAGTVPIGVPVPGVRVEVLDASRRRVPLGVPGELCLGGDTLARGYLGRPGLTAARFLPDPFSGEPGSRMYPTGDLVRWREDGTLEFLGRVDRQVKLRGFRIELGEIESQVAEHPGVREALVLLREDVPGRPALAAYVIAATGQAPTADELREHCAAALPAYMIPAAVVLLDSFPRDPNGKVDVRGLPVPEVRAEGPDYVAPSSPLERELAQIWAEILGRDRVGVRADFFELGGDSLAATRVIARVRRDLGVEVPTRVIFENRTISEFAAAVAALRAAE